MMIIQNLPHRNEYVAHTESPDALAQWNRILKAFQATLSPVERDMVTNLKLLSFNGTTVVISASNPATLSRARELYHAPLLELWVREEPEVTQLDLVPRPSVRRNFTPEPKEEVKLVVPRALAPPRPRPVEVTTQIMAPPWDSTSAPYPPAVPPSLRYDAAPAPRTKDPAPADNVDVPDADAEISPTAITQLKKPKAEPKTRFVEPAQRLPPVLPHNPRLRDVVLTVADERGVEPLSLIWQHGSLNVPTRHQAEVMYIASEMVKELSLVDIGQQLGGFASSVVNSICTKTRQSIVRQERVRNQLNLLTELYLQRQNDKVAVTDGVAPAPTVLTVSRIRKAVALNFNVDLAEMIGLDSRARALKPARALACYLMHDLLGMDEGEISLRLDSRSVSSVSHCIADITNTRDDPIVHGHIVNTLKLIGELTANEVAAAQADAS